MVWAAWRPRDHRELSKAQEVATPTWSSVRREGEEGVWTQAEAALRETWCRRESVYNADGSTLQEGRLAEAGVRGTVRNGALHGGGGGRRPRPLSGRLAICPQARR